MEVNREAEIMMKAIETYGAENQQLKACEECSELIKAIIKLRFAKPKGVEHDIICDAIAEEMADVEIMLHQMQMIFHNFDKVKEYREKKLERLERRLRDGNNGG